MSVFTSVSESEMQSVLKHFDIGTLISLEGIAQGVTNTNYFVTTTQDRFVLTIFEVLTQQELPFYLNLMKHLSHHGVAAPEPIAQKNGELSLLIHGKAACLISCLSGKDVGNPNLNQCYNAGVMLAKMHLATRNFTMKMDNPRFKHWWQKQAQKLYPLMQVEDAKLLAETIDYLDKHPDTHMPSGVIHADLFKDNVLINGDKVTGFIDFYYACNGSFIYDIAITVNDWAHEQGTLFDEKKIDRFISGYESVRPLQTQEHTYLNTARQAACVRFWVSRMLDYYFPAEGEITYVKDPFVFRDMLINLLQKKRSH